MLLVRHTFYLDKFHFFPRNCANVVLTFTNPNRALPVSASTHKSTEAAEVCKKTCSTLILLILKCFYPYPQLVGHSYKDRLFCFEKVAVYWLKPLFSTTVFSITDFPFSVWSDRRWGKRGLIWSHYPYRSTTIVITVSSLSWQCRVSWWVSLFASSSPIPSAFHLLCTILPLLQMQ